MEEESFTDDQVMEGHYYLEHTTENGVPARRLHLRTYMRSDLNARTWHATSVFDWPLIATFVPGKIIMYPRHVNPHTLRYLSQKNGRFRTVIYEDEFEGDLPETAEDAELNINRRLDWDLFDPPDRGLGLQKDLYPVWQRLTHLQGTHILTITARPGIVRMGSVICIGEGKLDQLRKEFKKTRERARKAAQLFNMGKVHDDLLTTLAPELYRRIVYVNPPLLEVRAETAREATSRDRAAREASIKKVQKELGEIAKESPLVLMQLHADIERVTLAAMIERVKEMIPQNLKEEKWQKFFENNKLVLSMAFARPVVLSHTQFVADTPGLDGKGAKRGDFLFKEQGQALAIVEIKRPDSPLLDEKPYRPPHVFAPHKELSGAITQVLCQQSALRTNWANHFQKTPSIREWRPDVIRCVVVAGTLPTDDDKLASFDMFRNACKDVDVITFDELLGKLELLHKHLAPPPLPVPPVENEPPF